jgi:hypothetical protein
VSHRSADSSTPLSYHQRGRQARLKIHVHQQESSALFLQTTKAHSVQPSVTRAAWLPQTPTNGDADLVSVRKQLLDNGIAPERDLLRKRQKAAELLAACLLYSARLRDLCVSTNDILTSPNKAKRLHVAHCVPSLTASAEVMIKADEGGSL